MYIGDHWTHSSVGFFLLVWYESPLRGTHGTLGVEYENLHKFLSDDVFMALIELFPSSASPRAIQHYQDLS